MKLSILIARRTALSESNRLPFLIYWASTAVCCLMVLYVIANLALGTAIEGGVVDRFGSYLIYPVLFLQLVAVVAILFSSSKNLVDSSYALIILVSMISLFSFALLPTALAVSAAVIWMSALTSCYFNGEIFKMR